MINNKELLYYEFENKIIIPKHRLSPKKALKETISERHGFIYSLIKNNPGFSSRCLSIKDPSVLFTEKYDSSNIKNDIFKKWTINVCGLGDVGSTLVTGLRLLGSQCISKIGIYDRDKARMKRWEFECGQILSPDGSMLPEVVMINEDELFNADMFVFCVSVGVPDVGKNVLDVRMAQFEGNSKIAACYAKKAREKNYKGIFAIVSDPVDLLCKTVYNESNKDENGIFDEKGLSPENIRGYGLGVMHARACYFAEKDESLKMYLKEGRAFGPHGEGLIIANSIDNYDEELSLYLTEKTKKANMEIRALGFKPYIAPALSSGSLSIIATIKSQWNYSAVFIGGTFWGCRNRLLPLGTEIENYDIPQKLYIRIEKSYKKISEII